MSTAVSAISISPRANASPSPTISSQNWRNHKVTLIGVGSVAAVSGVAALTHGLLTAPHAWTVTAALLSLTAIVFFLFQLFLPQNDTNQLDNRRSMPTGRASPPLSSPLGSPKKVPITRKPKNNLAIQVPLGIRTNTPNQSWLGSAPNTMTSNSPTDTPTPLTGRTAELSRRIPNQFSSPRRGSWPISSPRGSPTPIHPTELIDVGIKFYSPEQTRAVQSSMLRHESTINADSYPSIHFPTSHLASTSSTSSDSSSSNTPLSGRSDSHELKESFDDFSQNLPGSLHNTTAVSSTHSSRSASSVNRSADRSTDSLSPLIPLPMTASSLLVASNSALSKKSISWADRPSPTISLPMGPSPQETPFTPSPFAFTQVGLRHRNSGSVQSASIPAEDPIVSAALESSAASHSAPSFPIPQAQPTSTEEWEQQLADSWQARIDSWKNSLSFWKTRAVQKVDQEIASAALESSVASHSASSLPLPQAPRMSREEWEQQLADSWQQRIDSWKNSLTFWKARAVQKVGEENVAKMQMVLSQGMSKAQEILKTPFQDPRTQQALAIGKVVWSQSKVAIRENPKASLLIAGLATLSVGNAVIPLITHPSNEDPAL